MTNFIPKFYIKNWETAIRNSRRQQKYWIIMHACAFGFSIKQEKIKDFILKTNELLKDFDFTPCYNVDFIYFANNFNGEDILKLAGLESLWGQGIEEPLIAIENIKVTANNLTLMSRDKNPTLKITLPNKTSLIKFKSSEEEFNTLYSENGCITINVVGTCKQNCWNGNVTPQIFITDYEIVNSQDYYF